MLVGGHEHVEDAAAHGELPTAFDHRDTLIAGPDKACEGCVETSLVADPQHHRSLLRQLGGEGLHEGTDRHDQHVGQVPSAHVGDHSHPPPDGVGGGAQTLMRQCLPRGKDRGRAAEVGEAVLQVGGLPTGRRDRDERLPGRREDDRLDARGHREFSAARGQTREPFGDLWKGAERGYDIGKYHCSYDTRRVWVGWVAASRPLCGRESGTQSQVKDAATYSGRTYSMTSGRAITMSSTHGGRLLNSIVRPSQCVPTIPWSNATASGAAASHSQKPPSLR